MLFNSYAFVFLFFPLCILGFYISKAFCRKSGKDRAVKLFLIAISLWFYGFASWVNLPILLGSMAVNYGIYCLMEQKEKKRLLLAVGLAANLLTLFYFKYTGSSFVPLGISFFTFSQIAFLMECYRGNIKRFSLWDYGVYITFFPKLIEGPIALPHEIQEQIDKVCKKSFNWEELYRGMCLFILGLAKKVLLADTLGGAVDYGYTNLASLNSGDALIVMLSYTLQIYFDFSGYCDMAMGIGGMLSFSLPLNFNAPYKAGSIVEFWKRWHMTLTRFFTRYLYIPLGGSRKGKIRTYSNMLIVFLVSGIWHGAGWQFLIWGMMHGILYVMTKWWMDRKSVQEKKKTGIRNAFCVAATFLYVNAAWVFFRAPSVKEAIILFKTIAGCRFAKINWNLAGCFQMDEFWYVIKVLHIDRWQYAHYILMVLMLLVSLLIVFLAKTAVTVAAKLRPLLLNVVLFAALFVWCVVTFSEVSSFIYFNF